MTARQEPGLDLAERLGYRNKQMISSIETGRINVPPEHMADFVRELGVNLEEFVRTLLRYQNPWIFAAIFGADEQLEAELRSSSSRANQVNT